MSNHLLKEVIKQAGGMNNLACKVGKNYNALSTYQSMHKDNLAKITSYAVERACELFDKDQLNKQYTTLDNGVFIKFEIGKVNNIEVKE